MDLATVLQLVGTATTALNAGQMIAVSTLVSKVVMDREIDPPLKKEQQHQQWKAFYQAGAVHIVRGLVLSPLCLGAAAYLLPSSRATQAQLLGVSAGSSLAVMAFTTLYMATPNIELRDRIKTHGMEDARTKMLYETFKRNHWIRNVLGLIGTGSALYSFVV